MKFLPITLLAVAALAAMVLWRRSEGRWVREQRGEVLAYLAREGVQHRGVSTRPVWLVAPYVAVWSVESQAGPGTAGWWTISGDLPTDYVSAKEAKDARAVLVHFSRQWSEVAAAMRSGQPHPEIKMGTPDQWPELADLLQRRSELLGKFAADASIW